VTMPAPDDARRLTISVENHACALEFAYARAWVTKISLENLGTMFAQERCLKRQLIRKFREPQRKHLEFTGHAIVNLPNCAKFSQLWIFHRLLDTYLTRNVWLSSGRVLRRS
jgi:hypothetical protein